MALAIDASSPALTTQTSTTTATLASASFTPPAGSVLLIQWVSDGGATPGTPTITDNLGVPLSYTLLDWKAANSGTPAAGGQAASWRAVVGSSAAMIVTVTNGAVSGERAAALKITVLTGADTTTPIGAHNKSGSLSAASIAQTYTATSTGGQGFIVVCDFNQLGNETAGTGCTVVSTGSVLTNISYGFLRRTSADDVATVSNSLNVTIPGTSTNLSWTYAEVLPAATSTAVYPPNRTIRRRLATAPRLPRGRARTSTPVRAQVNPPFPFNSVHQPRRLRALSPRRGETAMPVPPQVVVAAPTFPPSLVRPRLKGLRMFRGDAVMPVPTQAAVVAATYPPQTLRSRVRGLRLFRPRVAVDVPDQGTPPAATQPEPRRFRGLRGRGRLAVPPTADQLAPAGQRPRLRLPRLARGRTVNPTPTQIVVTPPTYPPLSVRTRLRGLRLARGRAVAPAPAQIVVLPPTYPPPSVRARIRGLRLFRGRAAAPVLGHPPTGSHAPRARPHTPAPRRGHAARPVPPQIVVAPPAYPLRSVRSRLKGLRSVRGHQAAAPVPPQIVIVPPKIVPLFSRIKQHAARLFRGGQVRNPVVAVCDCETHRPNLGVTVRPGMGMTARPGSGMTARPGSGITAQPDTGTTSRPCTCSGGG